MFNRILCSAKNQSMPGLLAPTCDNNNAPATPPPRLCSLNLVSILPAWHVSNGQTPIRQLYSRYFGMNKLRIRKPTYARKLAYSCNTTLRREVLICKPPLYLMKPSLRNLFMKKLTRDRVVPIISASTSCDTFGSKPWGWSSLP